MSTDVRPAVPVIAPGHRSARRIALVAHDNRKRDLLEWARFNRNVLAMHQLFATGTTGALLEHQLVLPVTRFLSGPLGGDQQLGAKISEGDIDVVLFFWDPLEPQPHDPDVRALLRIAVLWNVPIACNRASADYLISSPLLDSDYERVLPDHSSPAPERVWAVSEDWLPGPGADLRAARTFGQVDNSRRGRLGDGAAARNLTLLLPLA